MRWRVDMEAVRGSDRPVQTWVREAMQVCTDRCRKFSNTYTKRSGKTQRLPDETSMLRQWHVVHYFAKLAATTVV